MALWPFKRRKRAPMLHPWDLSAPLLSWSGSDEWTVRDAVAGTLVLGATGSGKSSGSGACIAMAMLNAGFGGLVLTAKPDERAQWESYADAAGRRGDVLVFDASARFRFNFLDHELQFGGAGAGVTENVVQLFSAVLEIAERSSTGGGGREDEGYWRRSCRQLMRNLVDLLAMATGRVSVPDLYRAVVSAPTSFEQLRSEQWRSDSFCFDLLQRADRASKTERQQADFQMVTDYLCLEFPGLSDKTRSVIVSTFTSLVDVLNRGVLRDLFCGDSNIGPEVVEEGKVLIVDLPVLGFAEVGQFAQVLWKHAFQRAIERRPVGEETRPVFLWCDEAQYFTTSGDMRFATTCRGARVALVLLSQNISNFEAALGGGPDGKAQSASLFANLTTKVLHANGDPVTNEWAATLIGRTRQHFLNGNSSHNASEWAASALGLAQASQQSSGFSEAFEFELQPGDFAQLRTGGPENDWLVDAVVFQSGKRFGSTGRGWLRTSFTQSGGAK